MLTRLQPPPDSHRSGGCVDCNGTGAKSASSIKTCPSCKGAGQLRFQQGFFSVSRWQRIALEAAQQSAQWRLPAIAPPQFLATLLRNCATGTVTLMLAERLEGKSVRTVELPQDETGSVLMLIGQEGGWSKEEMRMAEQAGIERVALGPHILRAETAAISILQSRLGKLG